jgi:hypothetical protein
MADNGLLTVDQKVKVVLFYAETKSVVATQRRFCKRLRGKMIVKLNLFFIRNNFPAYDD